MTPSEYVASFKPVYVITKAYVKGRATPLSINLKHWQFHGVMVVYAFAHTTLEHAFGFVRVPTFSIQLQYLYKEWHFWQRINCWKETEPPWIWRYLSRRNGERGKDSAAVLAEYWPQYFNKMHNECKKPSNCLIRYGRKRLEHAQEQYNPPYNCLSCCLSDHQVKMMVVLCLRVLQEYLHLPESITGFSLSPGPKYGVGCDSWSVGFGKQRFNCHSPSSSSDDDDRGTV